MGLSYDDFSRLDFEEFAAIFNAYTLERESEYKDRWERTRMLATIVIQPHIKRKITGNKLLPFPWDKTKKQTRSGKKITAAQQRERMKRLVEKLGDEM